MFKKAIMPFVIFILLCINGCTEKSIDKKLEDLGYSIFCKDKQCYLYTYHREQPSFMVEKNENEFYYIFEATVDDLHPTYHIDTGEYSVFDKEDICITKELYYDSNCTETAMSSLEKLRKAYVKELEIIGITEKELCNYLTELYENSFI